MNFTINDINYLNVQAAAPVKVELTSQLFSEPYVYSPDDIIDYRLDYDLSNAEFSKIFDLSTELINTNKPIMIFGNIYNAFGSINFEYPVNILMSTINSDFPIYSTDLIEYFDSESTRLSNNGKHEWDSNDSLKSRKGLMVIPGYGLCYPYGNYTQNTGTLPINSKDYSEIIGHCTYVRQFFAADTNLRFGGTFIFDNLSKAEFEDENFTLEISIDEGNTWLDCKKDRQIYNEIYDDNGILTDIIAAGVFGDLTENKDTNQLFVTFGLNRSYHADCDNQITGESVARKYRNNNAYTE